MINPKIGKIKLVATFLVNYLSGNTIKISVILLLLFHDVNKFHRYDHTYDVKIWVNGLCNSGDQHGFPKRSLF